ncbi:hypothetical protein D3C80_1268250 [compost metagenome]
MPTGIVISHSCQKRSPQFFSRFRINHNAINGTRINLGTPQRRLWHIRARERTILFADVFRPELFQVPLARIYREKEAMSCASRKWLYPIVVTQCQKTRVDGSLICTFIIVRLFISAHEDRIQLRIMRRCSRFFSRLTRHHRLPSRVFSVSLQYVLECCRL